MPITLTFHIFGLTRYDPHKRQKPPLWQVTVS